MATSRYRVRFEKRDALRFISHHDLMRTFELALRRSGLRVAFTKGFNPHPKMSFAAALPLGVESLDELVDIDLDHDAVAPAPAELMRKLGEQMPPGLLLLDAAVSTGRARVIAADYECVFGGDVDPLAVRQRLGTFMAAKTHPYTRTRGDDKPARNFDARAFTLACALQGRTLRMRLRTGDEGGMKPSDLLTLLGLDANGILVTKTKTVLAEAVPVQTGGPDPATEE